LPPFASELNEIIDRALAEDVASGDPTTAALIPPHLQGTARLAAREPGVLAGIQVALAVFERVDPAVVTATLLLDGDRLEQGAVVGTVQGPLAGILAAERTALNFLQRMSGIATTTDRFVQTVRETNASIVDTRKTAPGLRNLDKMAVAVGGGRNHRQNLGSGILIKDNHCAALEAEGVSLPQIIRQVRVRAPHTLQIEVEAESVDEVRAAVEAGADIVLLDNMSVDQMREAVGIAQGRTLTEASGNVTLDNVAEIAATGVDLISVGALTHSVRALDIGLDFEP